MGDRHTPGPWFWTESKEGEAGELRGPGCNTVASPQVDIGDYGLSAKCWVDVSKADADLIASAPDLLAIARMAADGTYIPPQHAREVLERHGLEPGKDER